MQILMDQLCTYGGGLWNQNNIFGGAIKLYCKLMQGYEFFFKICTFASGPLPGWIYDSSLILRFVLSLHIFVQSLAEQKCVTTKQATTDIQKYNIHCTETRVVQGNLGAQPPREKFHMGPLVILSSIL